MKTNLLVMDIWWALSVVLAEHCLARYVTVRLISLERGEPDGTGDDAATTAATVEVVVAAWPLLSSCTSGVERAVGSGIPATTSSENGSGSSIRGASSSSRHFLLPTGLPVSEKRHAAVVQATFVLLSRVGERGADVAGVDGLRGLDAVYDMVAAAAPVNPTGPLPPRHGRLGLDGLNNDVLLRVMFYLRAPAVRALGCTCRRLRLLSQSMYMSVLPGLHLPPLEHKAGALLAHQRGVVAWMVRREGGMTCGSDEGTTYKEHPEYLSVACHDWGQTCSKRVYIHRLTLSASETVPTLRLGSGGCVSDRPGMGKTG